MDTILQAVINGLLLGGIYAVVAIGFSLVWGVMNIVNLAHGAFVLIGAYIAWKLNADAGLPPLLGMVVAAAALLVAGYLLQRYLINLVVNAPIWMTLLLTFGLSLLLVNGLVLLFTGDFRSIPTSYEGDSLSLGSVRVPYGRLFAFGIAIGFALVLFKVSPALITNWLPIEGTAAFVIVEGLLRVAIFIAYLLLIGLLPDLKRVFQYHGAEHKAINALEAGEELEPERVQKYSLIHPRCGTAFLLWVMVIAIFVFAFLGRPEWYWLIASRILLLPLIAGIAYELIRFAGKHTGNRVLMTLLAPGLWLQRLTTREPTLEQIEVSVRALKQVLRLEEGARGEQRQVEVMA